MFLPIKSKCFSMVVVCSWVWLICGAGLVDAHQDTISGDVKVGTPESGAYTLAGALASAAIEPSTGVFHAALPIEIPKARGTAQPGLAITYSSTSGTRELGEGWGLNLPVIERKNISGSPLYHVTGKEDYKVDQFTYSGAKLIAICKITNSKECLQSDEPLPEWVVPGMAYFRLENDTTHARFFWWPNGLSWRVQFPGGEIIELGASHVSPLDIPWDQGIDYDAIFEDTLPNAGPQIVAVTEPVYRWNIVRRYDPYYNGVPKNIVVYRWGKRGDEGGGKGKGYLTDIYYTSGSTSDREYLNVEAFAHHLHLEWMERPVKVMEGPVPIWRSRPQYMLSRLDVTSKQWGNGKRARELVRRYHFSYSDKDAFYKSPRESANLRLQPHLRELQLEGRCNSPVFEQKELLPDTACPLMPSMKFHYSTTDMLYPIDYISSPQTTTSVIQADPRVILRAKLLHSTDLITPANAFPWIIPIDINSDSLPDLVDVGKCRPYVAWNPYPPKLCPPKNAEIPNQIVYWSGDNGKTSRGPLLVKAFSQLHDPNDLLLTNQGYTLTGDLLGNRKLTAMFMVPSKNLDPGGTSYAHSPGVGPWNATLEDLSSDPTQVKWNYFPKCGGDGWPDKFQLVGDVDGDGLIDTINWASEYNNESFFDTEFHPFFSGIWRKKGAAHLMLSSRREPISTGSSPTMCSSFHSIVSALVPSVDTIESASYSWQEEGASQAGPIPHLTRRSVFLADMNGDTLADLVAVGPDSTIPGTTSILYWPGDGRGNFTTCSGSSCHTAWSGTDVPGRNIWLTPSATILQPLDPRHIRIGDVTGDGLADMIYWDLIGIHIFVNWDGTYVEEYLIPGSKLMPLARMGEHGSTVAPWSSADMNMIDITFADMNGNGINDLVLMLRPNTELKTYGNNNPTADCVWAIDLHFNDEYASSPNPLDGFAPRAGLLIEIDNGLGATTKITYESTADLYRASQRAQLPWPQPLPQVMMVVGRITTTTNTPEPYNIHQQVTFNYSDPVWDGWERRFLGFREITSKRGNPDNGDANAIWTRHTFFIPECPDGFCERLTSAQRAASGALICTEIYDVDNHFVSSVASSYKVLLAAMGLDGASAWFSHPNSVDTIRYDLVNWSQSTAKLPVTVEGRGPIWQNACPIHSKNFVLLRQTQQRDRTGRLLVSTNHGRIKENGQPIDSPIVTTYKPLALRSDWKFLNESMRVDPFPSPVEVAVPLDHPRETHFSYDSNGRLTTVMATLTGTVPLLRSHEDSAQQVAPSPFGASKDGQVGVLRLKYDELNNIIERQGVGGICERYIYDEEFGNLVTEKINYGGFDLDIPPHSFSLTGCASIPPARPQLKYHTQLKWDRGLEAVSEVRTPQGSVTQTLYDSFGRISAVRAPDPQTGTTEPEPSWRASYLTTDNGPLHQRLIQQRVGEGTSPAAWHRTRIYEDALGQTLLTLREADTSAGDGGHWRVSGLPLRDGQNNIYRAFMPWFYDGDPEHHPISMPITPHKTFDRDHFGRVVAVHRQDGEISSQVAYGALTVSITASDGSQTYLETDGFDRLIQSRRHSASGDIVTNTYYLVLGEPTLIARSNPTTPSEKVVRWMQYDSLGRMVVNAEPNTSLNFSPDPTKISNLRSWRYAYDDVGRLVGTSDARGCGKNLLYDRMSRLVAEDYSPCRLGQPAYTAQPILIESERLRTPSINYAVGAEVWYQYDSGEPDQTSDFGVSQGSLVGRLVARTDRAGHSRYGYDMRGQVISHAMQPARPGLNPVTFTPDWFRTMTSYDPAGRISGITTGALSLEFLDPSGKSDILYVYGKHGHLTAIRGSYGDVLNRIVRNAAGSLTHMTYGDLRKTTLTLGYDNADRLKEYRIFQAIPGGSFDLEHLRFDYLPGNLLKSATDLRDATAAPSGTKPASRIYEYDGFRRVSSLTNSYCCGGMDTPTGVAFDDALPPSSASHRMLSQTIHYDWQGNTDSINDDTPALFERSLGPIVNGLPVKNPNQLISSANGQLQANYDASGNLIDLSIQRSDCAAPSGKCTHRLRFDWDEVGNLSRARRWDYTNPDQIKPPFPEIPTGTPVTDLRFQYNAFGGRVLKSVSSIIGTRHTVQVFPSLRLDRTTLNETGSFQRSVETEVIMIPGVGRVVHRPDGRHVLLELTDYLGSIGSVIDKDSGQLVQRRTFYPYGTMDSDYRATGWENLESSRGFTGKDHDWEVGLIYFGARYYMPGMGRWLSPDPLTIHGYGRGSDPNPYAYVSGQVSSTTDPLGLSGDCFGDAELCAGNSGNKQDNPSGPIIQIPIGSSSGSRSGSSSGSFLPGPHVAPPPPAPAPRNSGGYTYTPGPIESWVLNGSGWFHDFVTDDKKMENLQQQIVTVTMFIELGLLSGYSAVLLGETLANTTAATLYINTIRFGTSLTELLAGQSGYAIGGTGLVAGEVATLYGPYTHQINKGEASLDAIIREGEMIRTTGRWGDEAVRGTTLQLVPLTESRIPGLPTKPTLEFFTTTPPVPHGMNNDVYWYGEAGTRLKIIPSRIAHPDGSITIFDFNF